MRNAIKFILLAAVLALLLCGCSMPTVDELYCLPKRANSDSNLQEVIDEAMDGLQYYAPIAGTNQQTVQAADLDGDGKDEYLLFARDSSEKPLKILIFSEVAVGYVLMDTIEGYGFAFEFVDYADVDDRPGVEIIVGRQVSDQVVRSVSVYRFTSGFSRQLMTASYSRIITEDFDGDGREDLFLVGPGQAEDRPATAVLYSYQDEQFRRSAEVNLSAPAEALKRVTFSKLADGTPAVYASFALDENNLVTDVFTAKGRQVEIVMSGIKTGTLNNYYVYPEDIDSDGTIELPKLLSMPVIDGGQPQYLIEWQSLDPSGVFVEKLLTYHNHRAGWYLRLNSQWKTKLTVLQSEDAFAFCILEDDGSMTELFSILVLTGPDRQEQAKQEGRYLLHSGETEVYALALDKENTQLDVQELISSFRLIRMDWNNEENREDENEKSSDSGR